MSAFLRTVALLVAVAAADRPAGQRMDGWVVENRPAEEVTAAFGIVTINDRDGWVRTTSSFETFVLTFDARAMAPGMRAAVAILGRLPSGIEGGSAHVIPLFGRPAPEFPLGSMHFNTLLGSPTIGLALRPMGDWQRYRIERRGDGVVVASINGEPMLSANVPRPVDGWIGVRSQGGTIEVRNLALESRSK